MKTDKVLVGICVLIIMLALVAQRQGVKILTVIPTVTPTQASQPCGG